MLVQVAVPGSTSNLCHGFDCMGLALDVHNTISVETLADSSEIRCTDAGDGGLLGMAKTVHQACSEAWGPLPGIAVSITGSVPISRGLGSSSTIYIGLAAAMQRLAGRPLDHSELIHFGVQWEGHPDNITAAALGGLTLACDQGGELSWQHWPLTGDLQAVVAIPNVEVRTADARQVLPDSLSRQDAVRGWQRSAMIAAALVSGQYEHLPGLFDQGWHEQYRAELNPGFYAAREAAGAAGAYGTFISGSGSTVLSLVASDRVDAVHDAVVAAYAEQAFATSVTRHRCDNEGIRFVS